LRGFLLCPKCGTILTGSGSSGNGGKYYYYHCNSQCGVRFKAKDANNLLLDELDKIGVNNQTIRLFEEILQAQFKQSKEARGQNTKEIDLMISKHQLRISNAQQMMVDGEITPTDYRDIKGRYEPEIIKLKQDKADSGQINKKLAEHLSGALQLLLNLRQYYVQQHCQ